MLNCSNLNRFISAVNGYTLLKRHTRCMGLALLIAWLSLTLSLVQAMAIPLESSTHVFEKREQAMQWVKASLDMYKIIGLMLFGSVNAGAGTLLLDAQRDDLKRILSRLTNNRPAESVEEFKAALLQHVDSYAGEKFFRHEFQDVVNTIRAQHLSYLSRLRDHLDNMEDPIELTLRLEEQADQEKRLREEVKNTLTPLNLEGLMTDFKRMIARADLDQDAYERGIEEAFQKMFAIKTKQIRQEWTDFKHHKGRFTQTLPLKNRGSLELMLEYALNWRVAMATIPIASQGELCILRCLFR